MRFFSRKMVKPEDLNAGGSLFGGKLLSWIDEEAAIFAICQLSTNTIVTKFMTEIDFVHPAKNGDIVEIGLEVVKFGKTSITLKAVVRLKDTNKIIITIDRIVFVAMGPDGKPKVHGRTDERII